jgi:His-Xaa-Ser system protein HxsD
MIITLHSEVYPIETILQTCYQFIELAYFHIDLDASGKKISVNISFKTGGSKKVQIKEFRGRFLEELLHSSLRYAINKRNKKLREYIVGSALFSHVAQETKIPQGPLNDPLGIAIPWEQRNGKS